jgi:predicted ester cyclase
MTKRHEDRIRIANAEVLGKGDLDRVDEFFATDYVLHAGGKNHRGLDFVRRFIRQLRSAVPDLRVVKVEVLSQAPGRIVWQRTLRGTHKASLKGIPPSGQRVEWRDMVITRFDGAKIAEDWAVSELAGELLLKQRPVRA